MADPSSTQPLVDVHVADWTVVHVREELDAAAVAGLAAHLRPLLEPGARVALDVRRATVDPSVADAVLALADAAASAGARLVVVEPHEESRELLRRTGVPHVHESLDAAVHDLTPPARDRDATPMAPAASDATLVAAEDLLGRAPGTP